MVGHVVRESLWAIFVVGSAVLPILYRLLGKVIRHSEERKQGAQERAKRTRQREEKFSAVVGERVSD